MYWTFKKQMLTIGITRLTVLTITKLRRNFVITRSSLDRFLWFLAYCLLQNLPPPIPKKKILSNLYLIWSRFSGSSESHLNCGKICDKSWFVTYCTFLCDLSTILLHNHDWNGYGTRSRLCICWPIAFLFGNCLSQALLAHIMKKKFL